MGTWLDAFGRTWLRVEDAFWRLWRRLRRRQAKIEAGARQIGYELWDLVDELPFVPDRPKIGVPVRRSLYGHGAFMGAAPALLADPRWRRIVAFLMPDVYAQVQRAVSSGASSASLVPFFENNPVMCAFGVHQGGDVQAMEWDVFVDGDLVAAWEIADEAVKPPILARVVDTLLIAHASTTDTVQEALGLQQYQDVRKTPKSLLGGVEPGAWLDLFDRALELADAPDVAVAIAAMASEPRVETDEECRKHTFARPRPSADVVRRYRERTGRRFSVVVEIKSLRSTPELLRALVGELNRRGVHVAAVGSFLLDEIAGVSRAEQHVDGDVLDGPREILFQHFAGDLQAACDAGLVPVGQCVMFNGASLLDVAGDGYAVKEDVVVEIAEYVGRYELHLGLYVQEGDCDAAAASLLSELVHRDEATFDLGFAWGGLVDEAPIAAGSKRDHRGYGSQKVLERVGRARQWKVGSKAAIRT